MATLTNKQLQFIDEYFKCGMNGAEAARRLKYSYPNSQGARLLSNVNIRAEINRRLTENHMGADEVLARLAEQARVEQGKYLRADGTTDLEAIIRDGKQHLIKGVKPTKFGPEVMFYDGQTALLSIGKQHGLFSDHRTVELRLAREVGSIIKVLEEELNTDEYRRILSRLSSEANSEEEAGGDIEEETE